MIANLKLFNAFAAGFSLVLAMWNAVAGETGWAVFLTLFAAANLASIVIVKDGE